jgi:biotin carboxylase
VIKPVDSQGQRGIACVETRSALEEHLAVARSFSREHHVLVEEYYPSTEVTVSGWAAAPESVEIWTVTDRVTVTNPPSLGICIAHRFPCAHPRYLPEIRDLTERIVRAFELSDGPIYFQMLVGDRGVLVNEVAFRLGGAYEDISLPLVTGIDVLGRQLDAIETAVRRNRGTRRDGGVAAAHHRGPDAGEPAAHHRGPGPAPAQCFAVPLIFAHPGVIHRYRGDDIVRSQPGVYDCQFLLPLGTEIRPMQNATQRIAYAVVAARTREAVRTLIDFVFDTLRAEDEAGNNLIRDTRDQTYLTDDA